VGLRPGTPDNVPLIGRAGVGRAGIGRAGIGSLAGLTWATGHHRNGILLAPLTAELVVETLLGEQAGSSLLSACDPLRFAVGMEGPPSADLLSPIGVPR
jgi:glycine oxidase